MDTYVIQYYNNQDNEPDLCLVQYPQVVTARMKGPVLWCRFKFLARLTTVLRIS